MKFVTGFLNVFDEKESLLKGKLCEQQIHKVIGCKEGADS